MTVVGRPRRKPQSMPVAPQNASMRTVLAMLAGGAGLFLAWMAADGLFLIFAGLLFAALLDACMRGLSRLLSIPRGWNLAIVSIAIALAIAGLLVWSGLSVAQQIDALVETLTQQLHRLEQSIVELGVAPSGQAGNAKIAGNLARFLFPNPQQLFGEARSAFTLTMGGIGSTVIILLIGGFVAADPGAYRRGILELLPLRHRADSGVLLDEISLFLRRWLIGQLLAMLLLAALTWIMLLIVGVPSPLLLGIQAGLFNFIPYLGAVIGGTPILLMALPLGASTVLITIGLFTAIHVSIAYVLTPIIQKQAVHLPPALTLASLVLFGVLFGIASVAVATPLVAAMRFAFLRVRNFSSGEAQ
jgi:predicted PurR-regulated permease PerM